MHIQITKRLIPANIANIMLCIVLYVVLWLLPCMTNTAAHQAPVSVPALFLQHYTLWVMPAWAASLAAMLASAFILYRLWLTAQKYRLVPVRTSMPLLIGALFISCIGYVQCFDHRYMALILFLEAIRQMMEMYSFENQTKAAFNTALFIGAAALFEPMYAWMVLLFVISLIVYRAVSWRTLTSLIVGLVLLVYMVACSAWLAGDMSVLESYISGILGFAVPDLGLLSWQDAALAVLTVVLWLVSVSDYVIRHSNYNMYLRLNFMFISWSFVFVVILMAFSGDGLLHLIPAALVLLILDTSLYFTANQNNMANIVFILTAVTMIVYRITWLSLF
ncbi:MAG: hypothetical protein ACI3Z7_06740 [Candidatus Aphodosoma sp.]